MSQKTLRPLRSSDRRRSDKHIILTTMRNFSLKVNPLKPDLKGFLPYNVFPQVNNYYYENLEKNTLPFHYHVNFDRKDWKIEVATPLNARSDMMENAISAGYVPGFFRDAIVIAIQDDYAIRIPDVRTYEVISSKVLAPLASLLKLGRPNDSVFFLDEIFDITQYEKDMSIDPLNNPYKYEFRPMRYFDRVQFNLESRRFY